MGDRRTRVLASVLGAVALTAVLVRLFSELRMGAHPGFVLAVSALLGFADLLSAIFLVRRFRESGQPRVLVMSWACLSSLVVLVGTLAASRTVFGADALLGGNASTALWLWAGWHTALLVLLGVAFAPWPASWEAIVPGDRRRRVAWASVGGCVVGGSALVAVVVRFDQHLPVLINGLDTTARTRVVGPIMLPLVVLGTLLAVIGGWRSDRPQRWAAVAAAAVLGEVILTLFFPVRYGPGWYAGRVLILVGSVSVLVALLNAFNTNRHRLAVESSRLREVVARTGELERLQRCLLDHMADGVVMHDRDHRLLACNPGAESLLALTAGQMEDPKTRDPGWHLLHADGTPMAMTDSIDRQTLRTGVPMRNQITGVCPANGDVRWLSLSSTVVPDSTGAVDYVVTSMTDVTTQHTDHLAATIHVRQRRTRITEVLAGRRLDIVFQPIVELATGTVIGAEALSRFHGHPARAPQLWFSEAADVGLGIELELAAIGLALDQLDRLSPGAYLSLNASPSTVTSPRLHALLATVPMHRLVLELTEHIDVDNYCALDTALAQLRAAGVRLAVDDAGAGFSSLRHILNLRPDMIKLDLALTRGIDTDPARRALANALLTFGTEIGAEIIAEGVETETELDTLRTLGVRYGQGYHLGRPTHLAPRYDNSTGDPLPLTHSPGFQSRAEPAAAAQAKARGPITWV